MRRRFTASLLAALAALALADAPLLADVIAPIGLAPGSQYQLIFVTAVGRNANSSDIEDYNTFVTAEAAQGEPFGLPVTTWHAVASTDDVDANVNAPSGALPVYNTAGELVAAAGVGIYTGTLTNAVGYDQFGAVAIEAQFSNVWTGSDFQGFGIPGATLGSAGEDSEVGQIAVDSTWLQFALAPRFDEVALERPLYALSEPLTTVPEPSALALVAAALLMIGGERWIRRRR
jgi:hypothetical protein